MKKVKYLLIMKIKIKINNSFKKSLSSLNLIINIYIKEIFF